VEHLLHRAANNCVSIQGFHETLTEQVQSFEIGASDQTASMKLKLNPEFKGPLKTLCDDKDTTVIVVSGYGRIILEKVIS
jgi:trehalose 6-phosphate synthase/phosphatase